ncbi:hypothetical protein ACFL2H_12980, partial [Planctomycetota bacterium]
QHYQKNGFLPPLIVPTVLSGFAATMAGEDAKKGKPTRSIRSERLPRRPSSQWQFVRARRRSQPFLKEFVKS